MNPTHIYIYIYIYTHTHTHTFKHTRKWSKQQNHPNNITYSNRLSHITLCKAAHKETHLKKKKKNNNNNNQKEKKEKKRIKQAIEIANLKLLCLAHFIVFEIANIKQAINKIFKTKIKVSEQPALSQIKFLVLSF